MWGCVKKKKKIFSIEENRHFCWMLYINNNNPSLFFFFVATIIYYFHFLLATAAYLRLFSPSRVTPKAAGLAKMKNQNWKNMKYEVCVCVCGENLQCERNQDHDMIGHVLLLFASRHSIFCWIALLFCSGLLLCRYFYEHWRFVGFVGFV